MAQLLGEQLWAILGSILLFGVPGWAASRLLQLHLRVPLVLLPAVFFVLGLGVWTLALLPTLGLGQPVGVTLAVHAVLSVGLVVLARLRERRRGHAKRGSDAVSIWTVAVIALCALAALALRTRIAFDALFHLGMVRRLLELDSPDLENLDRIVGAGINPAYALPTWQAGMAGVAAVTGLDPATVFEAMAVVAVLIAACSAAALGRVVTGTVAGEIAGVAMYGWLRVFFPRRELEGDGVAYAAVPGNVAFDVMLPIALVVAVLLLQSQPRERGNRALALLGGIAVALLVVLHANYVVYLAIIGAGAAGWLVAAGPWSRAIGRRLLVAGTALAVPGVLALAALLPLLVLLEHFGAGLEDARIDYHLGSFHGWDAIRLGHLYDWFAAPGLLSVLLVPWAAWRARGAARAVIAGGTFALLAFSLVPPLLDLLGSTGSLTLGLRMPRPLGLLFVAVAAVALPDLIERVLAVVARARVARGRWLAWLVGAAPLVALTALVVAYGYPLARQEPAEYGWNWPTLVASAGLLVVLVLAIRSRRRAGDIDGAPIGAGLSARTTALAVLAIGMCMLPSGIKSARRAAWQATDVAAAYRADDLRCLDGVQAELRDLPAGSVLLADPVTGYAAQALAPVYLAADFKVWNGTTDSKRIDRRVELLRDAFNAREERLAGEGLTGLDEELGADYLLVARGEVEPPLDSDLPEFDSKGLRALLDSGDVAADLIAEGGGRLPDDADEDEIAACELQLWKLAHGPSNHRIEFTL